MSKTKQDARGKTDRSTYGFWAPRIWSGINMTGWFRLLARHRFAVSPSRVGMVLIVCGLSVFNSFLWLIQMLVYGRKIARTEIAGDPIFVIGHWRSGTTLLHELMVLDPRHTYPNTYQCFAPNHFLISAALIPWWLRYLMPARRPMDNMPVGWEYPQEDEFALCNMGIPSPYLRFAFSNHAPDSAEYLDLEGLSPRALARWKRGFLWFLKCLTLREPKRIVLKSPPHTARVKVLLEMFPDARFVHIVRDPYAVFPSTVKTWKRFYDDQGAQVPKYEGLEECVFDTFTRMYEAFEQGRRRLDPSHICDVRYEELVKDPIGQMRRIYDHFGLGEFDKVLPALEQYAARTADYKPGTYELPAETRDAIDRRWAAFIERYGYGRGEG